jgi:hypothetical protein
MPRVFVSHCAKHDKLSKAVLDHLVRDLPDEELELVWDHDLLEVGHDWDDKLLDEMENCDGAILLLSESALTRSYVVKECTLLANRKRHSLKWGGDTFELLSVLVGNLKPEDLSNPNKSHLKDLNLGRYQAGNDKNLKKLVEAMEPALNRLKNVCKTGTPREELLNDISMQIRGGRPDSDIKLAGLLNIDLPRWIKYEASPRVRSFAIATEMPNKKLRRVGRALAEAKDEVDKKSAIAIIERLAPFSISGDAASHIPEVAVRKSTQCLEINAEDIETGEWYARLAYGRMLRSETTNATFANIGHGAKALFDEVVVAIKDKVIADTIVEAQNELTDIGIPFFVFVRCPRPVEKLIDMVYEKFPTVTLVFLSGEKPRQVEMSPANSVVLLEPLLAREQEKTARDNYQNTITDVERAHGG